jgi:parallel beta-helix repeat protein
MNHGIVLTIVVSACLLSAILCPCYAQRGETSSKTIYVDVSNAGDPSEDGSASHPFDSIQKGVDVADAGDAVQVAVGVYYEDVVIKKSSISLVGAKGGTIIDGNETETVGIRVYNSPPNYTDSVSISGFTVRNCIRGITLSRSINIRLRDVSMTGNTYNFGDYTLQAHDIDTSNSVDGRPIYFWVNQSDRQVPADAGFVALVCSTNITVKGLDLTNNVQGLILKNTTHSIIQNVRITNNWDGLYLDRWSNNNTVIDNNISDNLFMGIYVSTSSSNTISNNSILNNAYGLLLDSTVYAATLGGIPGDINIVRYNTVSGNNVSNSSEFGVYLVDCEDNTFFHNNFNNTRQVYSNNSTSRWDDGAEGNYWADYAGTDSDKDGLGDTPYAVDADNQDNHPLMGMFMDFHAVWQGITFHVTAISDRTLSEFQFSQADNATSFRINNPDNQSGFCRVSVPLALLGGPYELELDGLPSADFTERSNGTHSFIYFTYDGVHNVEIRGTSVVPEFPSILLFFFLAGTTAAATTVTFVRKRLAHALSG